MLPIIFRRARHWRKDRPCLVQKFGSLQGVYEHLDDKAIKPKQREKLEANKELAELSHMLGTIRKDAPIETAPEHYCRTAGDPLPQPSCWLSWKCTS